MSPEDCIGVVEGGQEDDLGSALGDTAEPQRPAFESLACRLSSAHHLLDRLR